MTSKGLHILRRHLFFFADHHLPPLLPPNDVHGDVLAPEQPEKLDRVRDGVHDLQGRTDPAPTPKATEAQ